MDTPLELNKRLRPSKAHDWPLHTKLKERKGCGLSFTMFNNITYHIIKYASGNIAATEF